MDAPIYTFFKFLKDDQTEYISYDSITRYYEMLRYLMKNENNLFGGKKPIANLYNYDSEYKKILSEKGYTYLDIILFQSKLEVIKHKYFIDSSKIRISLKEIIQYNVLNDIPDIPEKHIKPEYIIIPVFLVSMITFLLIDKHIKQ